MPLNLIKKFDQDEPLRRAARRRVSDVDHLELSESAIDSLARKYLKENRVVDYPQLLPGSISSSGIQSVYLKDSKFSIGRLAETIRVLNHDISNFRDRNSALLSELQTDVHSLGSMLTEDEVSYQSGFNYAQLNRWSRPQDLPTEWADCEWRVDFKTGRTLLPEDIASLIPAAGITLPVLRTEPLLVSKVVLVAEETNVGSTHLPLVNGDPNSVLREGESFRYVIAKRHSDNTSKRYLHKPVYCTLLFEMTVPQELNSLKIKPIGASPVCVESVSYINNAGEEVLLTTTEIDADLYLTLLFEPVRTRQLKVKLVQFAPVSSEVVRFDDLNARKLNDVVSGLGWSQLVPENTVSIPAKIYDFSIETIELGLRLYRGLGLFESPAINIDKLQALAHTTAVESISITVDKDGTHINLPDSQASNETYYGVEIYDGTDLALKALIPIPDSLPVQIEHLPLVGQVGRCKLFPDVLYMAEKVKIATAEYIAGGLQIVFVTEHGFTDVSNTLVISAPGDDDSFNIKSSNWVIVDAFTVKALDYVGSGELVEFAPTPFGYIKELANDPFSVYLGDTLLVLGQDYSFSLDDGSTWLTEVPATMTLRRNFRKTLAGTFRIKVASPQYDSLYRIQYLPKSVQDLEPKGLVTLRNGRIVFDPSLQGMKARLKTVMMMRAETSNGYVSPVITSYLLKVKRDES
jgi:hypothetical protein